MRSAGTQPGTSINQLCAGSLAEVGVDISGERPKAIDADLLRQVGFVITVGRDAAVDAPATVEVRNWDTDEPPNAASTASTACA